MKVLVTGATGFVGKRVVKQLLEGGDEVVVLNEVSAHFRHEKHDRREDHQKHHHTDQVFHGVIGMKGDTVKWNASVRIFVFLDIDAIRIVRTDLMQGKDMCGHEAKQY